MKSCLVACINLLLPIICLAQIDPQNITIARDSFGVPHIYGKTDAESAFGLAWAHAEDDFEHIQHNLLAGKGMLGEVLGKDGVLFDFGLKFLAIDSLVEARYEETLSDDFKKVLSGYAQGINYYAATHPKEVLLKKAFPITEKDLVKGYTLQGSLLAGLGMALKAIKDNKITEYYSPSDIGSNAIAIAPGRTEDEQTWLVVNSHQPLEGRFAWYEAHVRSDEGWNIIGGLFPGGATIFVGTNTHLGWAHTTDYHNFGDIYQLEINPKNKDQYRYDGVWRNFTKRKIKLRVKLGFIKLGIKRTILETEFGPVFKTKHGWYSLRFPGYKDIRAGEQWYRMNKAQSLADFERALKMEALPLFNVVYGDRDGNILLHSGGQIPLRDSSLNWNQPITANTSAYKWDKLLSYERKPTLINPDCGYVFNCNQSPLVATGEACNWKGDFVGLQKFMYNRGERFDDLLKAHQGTFTWSDLRRIKFDKCYSSTGTYRKNFAALYNLDEGKYPDIADAIKKLNRWNLDGSTDNMDAALAMVTHDFLRKECDCPFALLMIRQRPVTEQEAVQAIRNARKLLLKTQGTLDVSLGTLQRHIRGNVSIPASGLREVSRAADAKLYDKRKGLFKIESGDGYMQMVKFGSDAIQLYTVNAYGASSRPDSPHYTDQMEMFQKEEFKKMNFDWDEIVKQALRLYKPIP